jgi:hypothetical protein
MSNRDLYIYEAIEKIMRFARNERELREWAEDHSELINNELSEIERNKLAQVYRDLMNSFLEKDAA